MTFRYNKLNSYYFSYCLRDRPNNPFQNKREKELGHSGIATPKPYDQELISNTRGVWDIKSWEFISKICIWGKQWWKLSLKHLSEYRQVVMKIYPFLIFQYEVNFYKMIYLNSLGNGLREGSCLNNCKLNQLWCIKRISVPSNTFLRRHQLSNNVFTGDGHFSVYSHFWDKKKILF